MKTRKFLVYCIIYTAVVAGLTYSLNSSDFTFELLGQAITLPVAVWVALPVSLPYFTSHITDTPFIDIKNG